MVTNVEIRGSWNLDEAVIDRWHEDNLDAKFRAHWPEPLTTRYQPFNDGEARPTPPGPYCVYEKLEPVVENHMTGSRADDTENQYQRITVQFRIHSKTAAFSGKIIARDLAKEVMKSFDPNNPLNIPVDHHVVTIRGADFPVREGDTEWMWVLIYEFVIDAEYSTAAPT